MIFLTFFKERRDHEMTEFRAASRQCTDRIVNKLLEARWRCKSFTERALWVGQRPGWPAQCVALFFKI